MIDETQTSQIVSAFGIWCDTTVMIGSDRTEALSVLFSSFSSSDEPSAQYLALAAHKITLTNTAVQRLQMQDGVDGCTFNSCLFGPTLVLTAGHTRIVANRRIPYWDDGVNAPYLTGCITVSPAGNVPSLNTAFDLEAANNSSYWGDGEPAEAGYVLAPGAYQSKFDMDAAQLGTYVDLRFDPIDLTKKVVVDYTSLSVTGFEIIDGQKVLVRMTGQGYLDNELPCPRGLIMKRRDVEGADALPTGAVVSSVTLLGVRYFQTADTQEVAVNNGSIAGALLTAAPLPVLPATEVYAIIGNDGVMVLRVSGDAAAFPEPGKVLFLRDLGAVAAESPDMPIEIGAALPIGPLAGNYVTASWNVKCGGLAVNTLTLEKTNDVLAEVPGLRIGVQPGCTYHIVAQIYFDTAINNTTGSKVSLGGTATLIPGGVNNLCYSAFQETDGTGALVPALVWLGWITGLGPAPATLQAMSGFWRIDGIVKVDPTSALNGYLSLLFAQSVTNAYRAKVYPNGFIRATRI